MKDVLSWPTRQWRLLLTILVLLQGLTDATPPPVSPVTPAKAETPAATQEGSYRNTAVVAGVIAAAAAYWLLSGSSKKEEKEH